MKEDWAGRCAEGGEVLSKTRTLNMIGCLQYRDLYGIDLLNQYGASKSEMTMAEGLYKEYKEYRNDREPGEEYELIANWGKDLGHHKYFTLIDEVKYRGKSDVDRLLETIEDDYLKIYDDDPEKKREMEKLLESQKTNNIHLNVVMYMVSAIQYLKKQQDNVVNDIALDVAQTGMYGISPEKDGYTIKQLPGKTFSGYQLLAWFYVSWAMAKPHMLAELKLPYGREYDLARKMAGL